VTTLPHAKPTFNCFFSLLGLQLYLARVHGDHTGTVLLQVPTSLRASGTSCCKFRQRQSFRYSLLHIPGSLRTSGTSCCKFPPASELQVHLVASSRQPLELQVLLVLPASERQVPLVQRYCQSQSFRYIFLQAFSKLRASGTSCKFVTQFF
jgi:hypothetical protein